MSTFSAMSLIVRAVPALNYAEASVTFSLRTGNMSEQTFSADMCWMHFEILLMAACLTSGSLSLSKSAKVWIRLCSVISLPIESEKSVKFLANYNLTFQDLSSPAASRRPRV